MSRIDRILGILDGAGQHTAEHDVSGPETALTEGRCWRCTRRDVAEDSSVCAPCRVFLLGDGPDPDTIEVTYLGHVVMHMAPDGSLSYSVSQTEPE